MNQISVNSVYTKNIENYEYECLAHIKNYSLVREKAAVGEGVTSTDFEMIFPNSIGSSVWKLCFFPSGQYVNGQEGDKIGIYLRMLSCEHPTETLKANVTFGLESENNNSSHAKKMNAEFDYSVPSKRWIGSPEFIKKKFLNSNRGKHFRPNDSLVISCLVEEIETHRLKETTGVGNGTVEGGSSDVKELNGVDNGNVERSSNVTKSMEDSCKLESFDEAHTDWVLVDRGKSQKKSTKRKS